MSLILVYNFLHEMVLLRKSKMFGQPVRVAIPVCLVLTLMMLPVQIDGQDARLVAKQVLPSVVLLETFDENGAKVATGSGFFVRPNVVATNYHVIKGASVAGIKMTDDPKTYWVGGIVGVDKTNDIALLSIGKTSGKPLVLVTDPARIEIGQEIFALGNPRGLDGTISPGIVSARGLRRIGQENLIQITAPISPGSSGGPVVNRLGQVIGMASGSLASGQNLNFAVPAVYIGILLNSSQEVTSFTKWAENELPSLEETAAWLTKVLRGHRGPTFSNAVVTDTRITFSGCKFEYWQALRTDVIWTNYSAGSLADLKRVGISPGSVVVNTSKQIDGIFLAFTFNERSIEEIRKWPSLPENDSRWYSNDLSIFLSDKRLGPSVENAFLRLQTLCART